MKDTELYGQLLGLTPPWTVSKVELRLTQGAVDVHVEHAPGTKFACPKCGVMLSVTDHAEARKWRHLDTFQYQTLLHARVPRVDCGEHGKLQVSVPWAEPRSRFTLLFERVAIDVLKQTSMTSACRILGLSWDEAMHLMRRAVEHGEQRRLEREREAPTRIGVDEKAIAKRHRYATLVVDLDHRVVVSVVEGRKTESLERFYEGLTDAQKERIECVAMDMFQGYLTATRNHVPGADDKVVHVRFHIMQHANHAVDKVRRDEHTRLSRDDDSTLARSRYLWLYARENVPEKRRDALAALTKINLATGRAWLWKEDLRLLWTCPDLASAKAFLGKLVRRAKRSGLRPVIKVAQMLRDHQQHVLNYFRHRVTNAACESINAIVDRVQRRAAGFRSFASMRLAVLFHCGGLDLYPTLSLAPPGKP